MSRLNEDTVTEPFFQSDEEETDIGVNTAEDDFSGAVPCFLPDEMESLGVFCDDPADNCYKVRSDYVSEEWFNRYKETGDPGDDWYDKVSEVYKEFLLDRSDRNKQRLLEYGWNPEVEFCSENVILASKFNRVRLNEAYSITIVDATHDYYIREDGVVDSAEQYLRYYAEFAIRARDELVEEEKYQYAKNFITAVTPYFEDNGESMVFATYNIKKIEADSKDYIEFIKLFIQTVNSKIIQMGEVYYRLQEKTDEQILSDNEIKIMHVAHDGDWGYTKEEI